MVYIVLGMHKSGTTLIAQTLHKSGVNMGWDLTEEMIDYGSQKCESPSVNEINFCVKNCEGVRSININHRTKLRVGSDVEAKIKLFIENQSKYKDWGFKDPRTVLTYPVWSKFLPEHKFVCIYRRPADVVRRYQYNIDNGKSLKPIKKFRNVYRCYRALKTWSIYNKKIMEYIKYLDPDKYILLNYSKMIEDMRECDYLRNFLKIEVVDMRNLKYSLKDTYDYSSSFYYRLFTRIHGAHHILSDLHALRNCSIST